MHNLTQSMRLFNDRVKTMNQTNSRQLVLTAAEARLLHSDMFNLIALAFNNQPAPQPEPRDLSLDGGRF